MDEQMRALVDAPLADPLKVNLPMGRRPGIRAAKPVYEGEFAPEKLTSRQLRERREDAFSAKLCSVLDYYAGTSIPVERVAEHTGLSVEDATAAMERRGRAA